jgi:hypothetical protein
MSNNAATQRARREELRAMQPTSDASLSRAVLALDLIFDRNGEHMKYSIPMGFLIPFEDAFKAWPILITEYRRKSEELRRTRSTANQYFRENEALLREINRRPNLKCRKRLQPLARLMVKP